MSEEKNNVTLKIPSAFVWSALKWLLIAMMAGCAPGLVTWLQRPDLSAQLMAHRAHDAIEVGEEHAKIEKVQAGFHRELSAQRVDLWHLQRGQDVILDSLEVRRPRDLPRAPRAARSGPIFD